MYIFQIFILLFSLIFSETFYLDCKKGSDSNDGKSTAKPWKSISKLHSEMDSFSIKDSVYFARGCVFSEVAEFNGLEGDESGDFIVDAYGSEELENPTFDYRNEVTSGNWVLDSGSIYYTTIDEEVTHVFVDDAKMNISHYPVGLENYFYLPQAQGDDTTIVDLPDDFLTLSYDQVVGSKFIMRSSRWTFHSTIVLDFDSGMKTLTIEDGGGYAPYKKNYGFFLMNMKWMLSPGTFYWDPTEKRLYLWVPNGGDPNQLSVKYFSADQPANAILITRSNRFTLRNMRVMASRETGIKASGSSSHHVTIQHSEVYLAGTEGIACSGTGEYCKIDSSFVQDAGTRGIVARYNVPLSSVTNNVIRNVFLNGPLNIQFEGNQILGHGIYTSCMGYKCTVAHNRVSNIGYIGIACYGITNYVEHNYVNSACMTTDDCGLIYWWKGGNHTVRNNLLLNSIGNSYGTPSYPTLTTDGAAQGIYPDDLSANSTITNNVIINAKWGFQLHNSQNNVIDSNVVFDSRDHAFLITEDTIGNVYSWSRDNIVRNNVFHSLMHETAFRITGSLDWVDMFEMIDNNFYFPETFQISSPSLGSNKFQGKDAMNTFLEEHRDFISIPWDAHSKKLGGGNYESVPFIETPISSNFVLNSNFSTGLVDNWGRWPSANIQHSYEEQLGCMKIEVDDEKVDNYNWLIAISNEFSIVNNSHYVLKFDMWCDDDQVSDKSTLFDSSQVVVRISDGNYASVGLSEDFTISADPSSSSFVYPFVATDSVENARIDIYTGSTLGVDYFLDNVELYEASVVLHDIADDFKIVYNEDSKKTQKIKEKIRYCDVAGQPIDTKTLELGPLDGMVLVKCFCNSDGVCNNFENADSCPNDGCLAVCGNGVCEKAEGGNKEDWKSCPEDCLNVAAVVIGSLVSGGVICILLVVIIVVVVLAFCIGKRKSNYEPQEEEDEMNKF